MNGRTRLVVAALGVAVVIGMIPVAGAVAGDATDGIGEADATQADVGDVGAGQADDESETDENESGTNRSADIRPGERFSGVVGVQREEFEGDMDARGFGVRLAEAETAEERADVIAEQLDRNERRLGAASNRQNELRERHAAGELSEGVYTARTAREAARVGAVNATIERSAEAADSIPDQVRDDRGIHGERIGTLRDTAGALSGPEVAEMAREIGGNRTGAPMGPPHSERPGAGPPGDDAPSGNESAPSGNESAPSGDGSGPPTDDGRSSDDGGPPGNGDRGSGYAGDARGDAETAGDALDP